MVTRADIVAEARKYLGTPFRHQGRVLARGCDCAGLVICVARNLGLKDSNFDISNYGRLPTGDELRRNLREHLDLIEGPYEAYKPGDILLMRIETDPQHLGILTEADYMIHAYAQLRRVTEHRIDSLWQSRIIEAYSFRGVENV